MNAYFAPDGAQSKKYDQLRSDADTYAEFAFFREDRSKHASISPFNALASHCFRMTLR